MISKRLRNAMGALLALACLLSASRALSRRFVFPTHRVERRAPAEVLIPHTLVARDGTAVHAFELKGPKDAPVLVHFHNNGETAAHSAELGKALATEGLSLLLVEYRGYGDSKPGEPSEEGLYLDAEASLDWLESQGVGPDKIILWGTSLGTGVAAEMARRKRGSALVLVTPYTSIPAIAGDFISNPIAELLVQDHFNTLEKAQDILVPTLIIHGDSDEVVPFWMGERLSGAIPGAALLRVNGGKHGDLFLRERKRLIRAMVELAQKAAR